MEALEISIGVMITAAVAIVAIFAMFVRGMRDTPEDDK
jgi:hypothetical protein